MTSHREDGKGTLFCSSEFQELYLVSFSSHRWRKRVQKLNLDQGGGEGQQAADTSCKSPQKRHDRLDPLYILHNIFQYMNVSKQNDPFITTIFIFFKEHFLTTISTAYFLVTKWTLFITEIANGTIRLQKWTLIILMKSGTCEFVSQNQWCTPSAPPLFPAIPIRLLRTCPVVLTLGTKQNTCIVNIYSQSSIFTYYCTHPFIDSYKYYL